MALLRVPARVPPPAGDAPRAWRPATASPGGSGSDSAGGGARSQPRRSAPARPVAVRPPPVRSVADIDLSSDKFAFRSGSDPRFSRPGARAGRRRPRADEEEDDSGDEYRFGDAPRAESGDTRSGRPARPTRGSAEARLALTTPLPLPEGEFRQQQAAARRAAAGGGDAAGGEEGEDAEPDEDLSGFEPRTLTREARADAAGAASLFFSGAAKSWAALGASAPLCAALAAAGAERPSAIQALAWAALAPGAPTATSSPHVLLADAAGSGKTLAYLAPLVAALRAREETGLGRAAPHSPHAVVLAPTAELAAQVLRVCRALSLGGAPFRAAAATGGHAPRTQAATLAAGVELLVGTPGRVAQLMHDGALRMDDVRTLVLDECDVLGGPHADFDADVVALRARCPAGARLVLVTASLPADAAAHLRTRLLGGVPPAPVLGPGLHRPAAGCQEVLVDCSQPGDAAVLTWRAGFRRKAEALARALASAPRAPTLVFCNTLDSCRAVENFLKRRDRRGARYAVHAAHAAVEAPQRAAALAALAAPPPPVGTPPPVVVATDRASRGLDCAGVRHVVLFDFPRDSAEYVRRVGRTARGAGGTGRATLLLLGRQVPLAREIMARNARGDPLEPLPAPQA